MDRVTRPLRAARARTRALRAPGGPPAGFPPGRYDSWLEHFHGERLAELDAACVGAGPEAFARFRDLDPDLWALLLTQLYEGYPNIRAFLPDVPDPALQELWNGVSGLPLAAQSEAFYSKLVERFRRHGDRPLADARVVDFGCGWGRLTRFLARDVAPGALFGCDPVDSILEECRRNGVPATLARSEILPKQLPFEDSFDLAFSFSVFTHISEAAHVRCLAALHAGMRPGGILVLTVRPPAYLSHFELMRPLLASLGRDPLARLAEPRYLFVPHAALPTHPQYAGGEMHYGETVITHAYMRERWTQDWEMLDIDLLLADPFQVMVTLRRR